MTTNKSAPSHFTKLLLFFCVALVIAACAHKTPFAFPTEQMQKPPAGMNSNQVPLFVSFGSDDNPYSGLPESGGEGGIHYLTDLFAARKNPAGDGNIHNFDGQPLHYSFYVNTIYITPQGEENPDFVKQSWKEAIDHGHEIGVHTHTHPHGREYSVKQWEKEIDLCIQHLTLPEELDIQRNQIIGFRTPFLEYNDHGLTAAQKTGLVYDCSIEEGFQHDQDGRNFLWPYRLDHGSPGNSATYQSLDLPFVRPHSNLWEVPVYAFLVPPDELCESYCVQPGFRARMKQKNDYFEDGKITGMDWNLWFEYGMDKPEFLATLKYTLDQHLQGNRCPMTVGVHSAIYSDRSPENPPKTTVQERREALREFLDYAISKPEVRVVSAKELLGWIHAPVSMTQQVAYTGYTPHGDSHNTLGAGFRYSVYGQKTDPGPAYWARVGKEMAARFPGATPEAIWIIGRKVDRGTEFPFPVGDVGDPLITGTSGPDPNEAALNLFDQLRFRIWLQVEPRFASTEKLLHLMLKQYSHHRCIVGIGIDVEWNKSVDPDAGDPVSDEEARSWLAIARSFNPNYRLFLKHWLPEKMPPTFREGLLFVDDSQILPSLDAMVDEFAQWGKTFAPSPVAFQFGYPSDRPWWIHLSDAPKEIGSRILQRIPNTQALFWVNFSVLEVFPPDQNHAVPSK
jgi:Polysaccharide deacetylase